MSSQKKKLNAITFYKKQRVYEGVLTTNIMQSSSYIDLIALLIMHY